MSLYISGPNLPLALEYLTMVTSPTGKGVIAMGGSYPGGYSKAIFELTQSMQWTRLEQTLKIGHCAPLAIPIPDELVYEKVESEDKEHQCTLLHKNCEIL